MLLRSLKEAQPRASAALAPGRIAANRISVGGAAFSVDQLVADFAPYRDDKRHWCEPTPGIWNECWLARSSPIHPADAGLTRANNPCSWSALAVALGA